MSDHIDNGNSTPPESEQDKSKNDNPCLAAALKYLAMGWPTLADCPPDHVGMDDWHTNICNTPGKVPIGKWKEYQTKLPTEDEVRGWYRRWPNANVGMTLGKVSRLLGIDVDGPGGQAKLDEMAVGDLPPTLEAKRGSNSRRLFYGIPDGVEFSTTSQAIAKKEELRFLGQGSQTVLPPSLHPSGERYEWVPGHGPGEIEAAPCPPWLVAHMMAGPSRRANEQVRQATAGGWRPTSGEVEARAISYMAACPPAISELGGHKRTMWVARVVVYGLDLGRDVGYNLLAAHYNPKCEPPWTEAELLHKCEEADTVPFDKPRGWLLHSSHNGYSGQGQTSNNGQCGGPGSHDASRNGKVPDAPSPPPPPFDEVRFAELVQAGAKALFSDQEMLKALARLSLDERARFVLARDQCKENGIKASDFDFVLKPLIAAATKDRAKAEKQNESHPTFHPYSVLGGCFSVKVHTKDGTEDHVLSNFTAKIIAELEHDDGTEKIRFFAIEGKLASGKTLPLIEVAAKDFSPMDWVVTSWGAGAIISAGHGFTQHLRAAIQHLSGCVLSSTVFTHTGWRYIEGKWYYLHACGAIGEDGFESAIRVQLADPLDRFVLPEPPTGQALINAVRASLRILEVAPHRITMPAMASAYRAVLGDTDFSTMLVAQTQSGKSEIMALMQQHWGATMTRKALPANWTDTENKLESLAHRAKDVLLVIDDFVPAGSAGKVERYHLKAERVLRAQGNHSGRGRLKQDTTERPGKPPRGLIGVTGEEVPEGHSLRARILALEVGRDDVETEKLTACQADAIKGLYAQAMAGYVQWLAPKYETLQMERNKRLTKYRDDVNAANDNSKLSRSPDIVANLAYGWRCFLHFAKEIKAISEAQHAALWDEGMRQFLGTVTTQATQADDSEQARLFLRFLASAFSSGKAHLKNELGGEPNEPQRWGWTEGCVPGSTTRMSFPQGTAVGWLTSEGVFLEPETAHGVAQQVDKAQGGHLAIGRRALAKRLNDQGYLLTVHPDKKHFAIQRTIAGARRWVYHMNPEFLVPAPNPDLDTELTPSSPF